MVGEYNFNKNLLKASRAKNIPDAKKEYVVIGKSLVDPREKCICGRKIKILTFLYNRLTTLTIIAGTGCCKQFITEVKKAGDNRYTRLLREYLEKGEYETIDDIIKYSNDVQATLIKRCEDDIKKYKESLDIVDLLKLKEELSEIKSNYNIIYLTNVIVMVDQAITEIRALYNKKQEEERIAREEALRKAAIEYEKERQVRAEAMRKAQIEREKLRHAEAKKLEAQRKAELEAREAFEAKRKAKAEEVSKANLEREKEREEREAYQQQLEAEEMAKKLRENHDRLSNMSTLICRACKKEFKDSFYRDNNCCSTECLWAKL